MATSSQPLALIDVDCRRIEMKRDRFGLRKAG